MDPEIFLYGNARDDSLAAMKLRAGPLSLVFDNGDIRYVCLGGREVLRRIYFAVRDPEWLTLTTRISGLAIDSTDASFRISFDARNRTRLIDFHWRAVLEGTSDGTIRFAIEGEAARSFLSNRIGVCVLHPAEECRGKPCIIEHTDGSIENSAFPDRISPHQPFVSVRSITHEVQPGLSAAVLFEGDVFETEDQRNWTDGSYKTYCPPLRGQLPREVPRGTSISHTVTLSWRGTLPPGAQESGPATVSVAEEPAGPLPRIGLGCDMDPAPFGSREVGRLQRLNIAHLRADISPQAGNWRERLEGAAGQARAVGVPLEAAVFLPGEAQQFLRELSGALDDLKPPVCRWLVFHEKENSTGARWVTAARLVLEEHAPAAPFGAGTNTYFAELNRGRNALSTADLLCYSANPQVHASDNPSMVEALQGQAPTVVTARHFGNGLPVCVSPITLKPRFIRKPYPAAHETGGGLPLNVDVRQASLFCAAWTVGSLKHLAQAGVQSVTYYETRGWRGILERTEGSPAPDLFPSIPDSVFPVYHIFQWTGAFAAGHVLMASSSAPLRVEAFALRKNGRVRVILANLSPAQTGVSVTGVARRLLVVRLNGSRALEACRNPEEFMRENGEGAHARRGCFETTLSPYELQRIDFDTERP